MIVARPHVFLMGLFRPVVSLAAPLLFLSCTPVEPTDTAPVNPCEEGFIEDEDGSCIAEACGLGTWGNLPVDGDSVYVNVEAEPDGDGSESAPLTSIQAGLDAAGEAGGGLVAVAGGDYAETLKMIKKHGGVHLAGRCRELVKIDASVGDESTPGIEIDVKGESVEVSGVTVRKSKYAGVLVGSGTVALLDSTVAKNKYVGVWAEQTGAKPINLTLDRCLVRANKDTGLYVYSSGTSVNLMDTTVENTKLVSGGDSANGIYMSGGASLTAQDCTVSGNTGIGIYIASGGILNMKDCVVSGNTGLGVIGTGSDTSLTLQDTVVTNTLPIESKSGFGVAVSDGARLEARSSQITKNIGVGLIVMDPGSYVHLEESTISDTKSTGEAWLPAEGLQGTSSGGVGLMVARGAELYAENSLIARNLQFGVMVFDEGTLATLHSTTIEDTTPSENGYQAVGIEIGGGATFNSEDCLIRGNQGMGLIAYDTGTNVTLQRTTIASTSHAPGSPDATTVGLGVVVEAWANVNATELDVVSTEGPGIYVIAAGQLSCIGCTIADNQFAGAVVITEGSLELTDSLIEGTTESSNVGGGMGIYANPSITGYDFIPTLTLTNTTIRDNPRRRRVALRQRQLLTDQQHHPRRRGLVPLRSNLVWRRGLRPRRRHLLE